MLSREFLRFERDHTKWHDAIAQMFGPGYAIDFDGDSAPRIIEEASGLEWLVVPPGSFVQGLSDPERAAALRLAADPFLSFEEMGPADQVRFDRPFLVMRSPITVEQAGIANVATIGCSGVRDHIALADRAGATALAEFFRAGLPSESQWEYFCRADTNTLFWWGNELLSESTMEQVLGLAEPATPNGFGCIGLFEGEWCADLWTPTLNGEPQPESGWVIRGGASRFWPWQDSREWAGCVSSFRMPSRDTAGAGAAVRLVRAARS